MNLAGGALLGGYRLLEARGCGFMPVLCCPACLMMVVYMRFAPGLPAVCPYYPGMIGASDCSCKLCTYPAKPKLFIYFVSCYPLINTRLIVVKQSVSLESI